MDVGPWAWIFFNLFILLLLALDLGVFNRKQHTIGVREALAWSAVWITISLLFNLGIYIKFGSDVALSFLTGYLIEKSLSVDNLFVIAMLFSYFSVPSEYQHKVLFWGVIGAIIMRGLLIGIGSSLIHHFHWLIYIFGAFLIYTGFKMAFEKDPVVFPENPVVRAFRKVFPVTDKYHDAKFFVKERGRRFATPLFIVVLVVELTDLLFAVDSIPAIFGITTDAFIIYTSNVFAILGLRSLYFALAGVLGLFHYLKVGLSLILIFIGAKMVLANVYTLPIGYALLIVASILILSVIASILWPRPSIDTKLEK
jgi:tellurite resistance protein TerC